jgi:hypothetical protein
MAAARLPVIGVLLPDLDILITFVYGLFHRVVPVLIYNHMIFHKKADAGLRP